VFEQVNRKCVHRTRLYNFQVSTPVYTDPEPSNWELPTTKITKKLHVCDNDQWLFQTTVCSYRAYRTKKNACIRYVAYIKLTWHTCRARAWFVSYFYFLVSKISNAVRSAILATEVLVLSVSVVALLYCICLFWRTKRTHSDRHIRRHLDEDLRVFTARC